MWCLMYFCWREFYLNRIRIMLALVCILRSMRYFCLTLGVLISCFAISTWYSYYWTTWCCDILPFSVFRRRIKFGGYYISFLVSTRALLTEEMKLEFFIHLMVLRVKSLHFCFAFRVRSRLRKCKRVKQSWVRDMYSAYSANIAVWLMQGLFSITL